MNNLKAKVKNILKLNSQRGWAIIFTVIFLIIISSAALMGPALRTTSHIQNVALDIAISRSEGMISATSSPIRQKMVKVIYSRIQQQLIDHLRKAQSGQPYVCQGVLTPPSSIGSSGNLENQFGLCEPEKVFDGLNGEVNQTIDYLGNLYPEHKQRLNDPIAEQARQSIVEQLENNYEYTLRTVYIGQKVMPRGRFGNQREERYQWSVRADVAMKTENGTLTRGLVIYYDVTLTNNFYANGFDGSGNACDFQETSIGACPDGDPLDKFGSSCVIAVVQNNDTGAAGTVGGVDLSNFPGNLPPDLKPVDKCESGSSNSVNCPIPGNKTLRLIRLKSVRSQVGCASVNTGKQGISGLDPSGYVFSLTARITHIGSTYN
ncbi:MAG: hypothetical protein WAQ98_14345 [Blastocatellia bacterium]